MIRRGFLTLALMLASVVVVRANGDPVAVRSALTLSPTPVAIHVPEVQLVDEHVSFVPRGLYTEVVVRYLLHNHSNRPFDSLPYGFPIDYWGSGEAEWVSLDDFTESEQEVGWRDGYIRNVSFMLGNRQLQWQHSRDSVIRPPQKYLSTLELDALPDSADGYSKHLVDSLYAIYGENIYAYTKAVSRRWYYTYLDIPAQSFATLEVRYTVETPLSEGAYYRRNHYYYYTPDYYWELRFMYDFTPAAYWGDGHADHFSVQLDASNVRIINEKSYLRGWESWSKGISGLPMKQEGDLWHYEAYHFDLAAAKPFIVDYKLKDCPQQPIDDIFNHRIAPSQFTVEVSGADRKYPAANLFDLDPTTATVLRPDKDGNIYITIRFRKPVNLEGILMLNGYTKNADTWKNNSRIDSMWISADYSSIHHFVPDTSYSKGDMVFGGSDWRKNNKPIAYNVPSEEPNGYSWQPLLDNASTFNLGYPWSDDYFTELHFRITATKKGLKYDDLCVSEILLISNNDK